MIGKHYYLMTFAAWQRHAPTCAESHVIALAGDSFQILALITADEAAHVALEKDPGVEPLPHPLARTPISERAAAVLAPFGVKSGDDTFTAAEKLAHIHPRLKHRVF